MARLHSQKTLDVLLRAAKIVLEKREGTIFVIVGEGPERERLEQLSKELGIEEQVKFTGVRRDVPEVLKAFDIAVLSSEWEVFPMFLLEAMASKLPVVSTRVGSLEEVVEENLTGFLVDRGDFRGLADKILELASDRENAQRMGERGRQRVMEHFSTRKIF
jgi:glycosyltransferase involved in cell wall biosynthesis